MVTYKNMRLYQEIKTEVASVIEAEEASKAWKQEARFRMKDVSTLVTAARKVNKDMEINQRELLDEIRAELAAEAEEAAAHEEPTDPDGYMYGETLSAADSDPAENTAE